MNPTGSEKGRLLNKSKPGHIIVMYLKLKKKENFENSKRKTTHHIQGNPPKAIIKLCSRNLAGQERVARYTQNVRKKNLCNVELYTWQECPLKWRER